MTATEGVVVLIGRVLFAVFFIRSGIAHVRKHEGMMGYARSAEFPFAEIGGWPAGLWLLVGAASIALGIWADVGSLMIALFVLLAGLYFHRFWTIQDDGQRQTQAGNFYRNVALLGGSLARSGFFVAVDDAVRFTLTGPVVLSAIPPTNDITRLRNGGPLQPRGLEIPAAVPLRKHVRDDGGRPRPDSPASGPREAGVRFMILVKASQPVRDADDFYGKAVNLAARIAVEARGSEILVSSLVRELTESAGEFTFEGPADAELKGLSGMYRLSSLRWQE